jgi:nitrate/TMAO reductase-like tetraheme cytochrome c subunit
MSNPVEPEAPQPAAEPDAAAEGGADVAPAPEAEPGDGDAAPRHRHPFYLRGRRLRLPSSRRGLFALLLVLSAAGFVGMYATVSMIQWTETADFCGRCHTMAPELQAFETGVHKSLTCADCHVEPGVLGWIKAKINGTKQLIEVVLGTYPTPIPPAIHSEMPSTADTCERCHGVTREAVMTLKTETVYAEDSANSPLIVGLLIRPGGGNQFDVSRSVHWHVLRPVTFYSADPHNQTIDAVEATQPDGTIATYESLARIRDNLDGLPHVDAITSTEEANVMSCYDCHNRVGHDITNPRVALDQAITTDSIDRSLPYIKREGMQVLWAGYPDTASAYAAADAIQGFYALNYPTVASSQSAQIDAAIGEIKGIYDESSDPDMKVTASTYADNLGHLDFPGCFRCHDGAHFKVVNGVATNDVIPSTCDTCHTFPQIGPQVASIPLGTPPDTHQDELWVFNHKDVATNVDPGGQSCGNCHAADYCTNCHSTGAVTVNHAEMATNHAAVIRRQGNTACAYCHQPVFCATCHGSEQVLPVTVPFSTGPSTVAPAFPVSPSSPPEPSPSASTPVTTGVVYPLRSAPGG